MELPVKKDATRNEDIQETATFIDGSVGASSDPAPPEQTTTDEGGAAMKEESRAEASCCSDVVTLTERPTTEGKAAAAASSVSRESTPTSEGSVEEALVKAKEGVTKAKRREHKDIEHLLRALNSLQTQEEKLAALCKKYTDLLEEHRILQNKFKQSQRSLSVVMREKDQLQTEHSKAVLAKSKLESLCRELQRHNKLVKEESLARAREEEEKRKEVTSKFQETINDIQGQMNDHYAKNAKLREENLELANKLKNLIEQYELREQHIEKVFKHKELEQQLVDAKLAQANLQMTEQKERDLKEKQILLQEATGAQKKIELLEAQEKQLRAQVSLYTEKYEEFQQTLGKSNEVFQSFKSEMEKMTKKIKKLEKETVMWKTRWENSNKALLEMAEAKTKADRDMNTYQNKIQKLESLCRALQEERKKTQQQSKHHDQQNEEKTDGVCQEVGTNGKETDKKEIELDETGVIPTKTPPNTPDGAQTSPEVISTQLDEAASKVEQSQTEQISNKEVIAEQAKCEPGVADCLESNNVVPQGDLNGFTDKQALDEQDPVQTSQTHHSSPQCDEADTCLSENKGQSESTTNPSDSSELLTESSISTANTENGNHNVSSE